jgi:hypothetical protein
VESILAWAGRLAGWLQGEGYAGPLGLDFQEHADTLTRQACAVLTDVHPRADGATYPLAILRRLNAAQRKAGRPEIAAFVSGALEPRPGGLTRFRRAAERFRYAAATGRGMVPYRTGGAGDGRSGVVMLGGSRDEVLRAYGELQTWCRREER